jgi:queuine tRNA-ribosyltransferase
MGVGKPDDILGAIERGVDMFDCVHPTRAGRHGHVYTRMGVINLKNARHRDDPRPLDEASPNANCRRFSRAYLHHLVRAEEMLGAMILSQINLSYYQELVGGARSASRLVRSPIMRHKPGPDGQAAICRQLRGNDPWPLATSLCSTR